MLKDVTTTLPDIQKRLLEMLTPQTIVVGHSLDSDLKALKLTHPFIVDSAILYPHVMGLPRKNGLQWLSKKYLNREIQKGTTGHDSAEDARAALDLVKLKCERGPGFGTYETNAESIFTRLGRTVHPRSPDCTRAGAVVDWGYPNRGHGSRAQVVIPCKSDQDVVEGIELAVKGLAVGETGAPRDVDFVWGRLRELELARGWWDDTKSPDVEEIRLAALKRLGRAGSDEETEITGEELLAVVSRTVEHIAKIYESLPRGTAFIVYSGTGDPREMRRLQAMNRQYHEEYRTKKWDDLSVQWTDREVQALSQAVNNARQGISFVTVK
jgi:RNA exonuclease 1